MAQLKELGTRLDRAGVPPAEDQGPSLGAFVGDQPPPAFEQDPYGEQEYGYEGDQQPEQGQPQSEEQQAAQQIQQMMEQAALRAIEPHLFEQEMSRRSDALETFAQQNPQIMEPEVMQRADRYLLTMDPNFGQEGYVPSTDQVRIAYLAAQADLAQGAGNGAGNGAPQTSTEPEGSEQGTAEAVGQQGATLETGAGPSAPLDELSPEEQAYAKALGGGGKPNQFGF
jgi:hypothetical protein